MFVASQVRILLWVTLFAFAVAPVALAAGEGHRQGGHRGPHVEPGHEEPGAAADRAPERGTDGEVLVGDRAPGVDRVPGRGPNHRRCRRGPDGGIGVDCVGGAQYDGGEVIVPDNSEKPSPPSVDEGAAKLAHPEPLTGPVESFTPQVNEDLKARMTSARKRWLEKKSRLEEADAARARAEYQVDQKGGSVDPAVIARQEEAQHEADAAQAAFAPLIEEAREQGVSPELIELYDRANRPY